MHLGRVITSPRCTVGRVNPSSSAFYQSKGRVDGSLDEPMGGDGEGQGDDGYDAGADDE